MITKTGTQASEKATELMAERYAQVVANLKQRGKAKPRTVPKLKSTIAALFHNNPISSEGVDAIVQQLKTHREISVAGSKVTYARNN